MSFNPYKSSDSEVRYRGAKYMPVALEEKVPSHSESDSGSDDESDSKPTSTFSFASFASRASTGILSSVSSFFKFPIEKIPDNWQFYQFYFENGILNIHILDGEKSMCIKIEGNLPKEELKKLYNVVLEHNLKVIAHFMNDKPVVGQNSMPRKKPDFSTSKAPILRLVAHLLNKKEIKMTTVDNCDYCKEFIQFLKSI